MNDLAAASLLFTQLRAHRLFGPISLEINNRISSGKKSQDILDYIFESLNQVIPYDRIGLALVEGFGAEAQIKLMWARSKTPIIHLNNSYSAPLKGSSLETILETGKPRIISNLVTYLANRPNSVSTKLAIADGIRSSLTCPLRIDGRQIGVVFFSSFKINTYGIEHVEIFQEIAKELSLIVERSEKNIDL